MNKDRIAGEAKNRRQGGRPCQPQSDGKAEKVEGQVQSAWRRLRTR
jgi:hypothetical protein